MHAAAVAALSGLSCHPDARLFDSKFDVAVPSPAYHTRPPRVLFDEGHHNYHTANGRYRPFVSLLRSDGYRVVRSGVSFRNARWNASDILVIANASGPDPTSDDGAFADAECDTVRDWVRSGGALLLITDHYPFAGAAAGLALRFGVRINRGITEDLSHSDASSPYLLVFTRDDGLIPYHPITEGRQRLERITRVMSFGGTSLAPPVGAVPFLKLSPEARDRPALAASKRARPEQSAAVRYGEPARTTGTAQAIALEFGQGRVVVLGEAGMLSAQVRGTPAEPFGMNVKGLDNRQLALNIMHWLSRLLP